MGRDLALEQAWRKRMGQCEQSGLTIRQFCEQEGLVAHQLSWWRSELKRRKNKPGTNPDGLKEQTRTRTNPTTNPDGLRLTNPTENKPGRSTFRLAMSGGPDGARWKGCRCVVSGGSPLAGQAKEGAGVGGGDTITGSGQAMHRTCRAGAGYR